MSGWLIVLTGLIYLYVSIEQVLKGNPGMGIAYFGYAFSNIGLYLLATKQETIMEEPQRRPLDPTTPKIPSVKKIPMPSVEKELHDLIQDSKEYLKERKNNSS